MRVLQIVQKPQRRGAEVFAFELSHHLRARGAEVRTVYLYRFEGERPLPLEPGDICLGGDDRSRLERLPGIQPGMIRRLLKEIRRFDPDIVQVNGSRSVKYGAVAKRIMAGYPRWKLVYRNIDMPSFWNPRVLKVLAYRNLIMSSMDAVVGVSEVSLEEAIRLYKLTIPATAILNGVDALKFDSTPAREQIRHRMGATDDDIVLLFAGSLVPQKRPDRFIRVLERVSVDLPNVLAWVVGDGPLRENIQRLTRAASLDQRCRMLGYQERVGDFMQAADLLVMTSDTEGIPAVILEAGYMGLPVVATNVGALSECVQTGCTGILVQAPFEEGLSKAIVSLGRSPAQRHELGHNARLAVQERFTMDRVAEKYMSFYKRVLIGDGRRRNVVAS